MPRVLLFRTDLLPVSETFISAQAAALRRFQPLFAGLRPIPGGLPVEPSQRMLLTYGERRLSRLKRRCWLRFGFGPSFVRQIHQAMPVLIHAHFAIDAAAALPLQKRLRTPLIVTLHGYDVTRSDAALRQSASGRAFLRRRRELWRSASLFLCVSQSIRQRAIERGFPREKLCLHRIGVDLSIFSPPQSEREPVVLFVGRLVEKKGCADLINAMTRIHPEARLVIIGDGPLRASLERQAAPLRRCEFLGAQPPSAVRAWMARASVLAAPSLVAADGDAEGLPIVLCEAQAMALPIAGYRGPGVSEAVEHGETGLLVEPGNRAALAETIAAFLLDPVRARRMGEAGRRRAALYFDLARQTDILEDLYAEVLAEQAV